MKFIKTNIDGLIIIEPKVFEDERGYFCETFKLDALNAFIDKPITFIQENESKSSKGVLRGLHFQLGQFSQTKLVRVIQGKVLDVVVDLRANSTTFGETFSIILDDINKQQLLVPKGFAHGFVTLSDNAIFNYKVDEVYSPENDSGISYNDPTLHIDWQLPAHTLKISQKDQTLANFDQHTRYFE